MSTRRHRIADAPLLAWGDTLRAEKLRRARLRQRIAVTSAGIGIVLLTIALPPVPRLVWNATPSAPIGLYVVTPGADLDPGDMVIARVPERFRRLAAERRYLPMNVPLVKRVAAIAGDEVCGVGVHIFIDGSPVAVRRLADGAGRLMPVWTGCMRLHGRDVFLLTDNPASFDGRYFGITEGSDVVGEARLLWRR